MCVLGGRGVCGGGGEWALHESMAVLAHMRARLQCQLPVVVYMHVAGLKRGATCGVARETAAADVAQPLTPALSIADTQPFRRPQLPSFPICRRRCAPAPARTHLVLHFAA